MTLFSQEVSAALDVLVFPSLSGACFFRQATFAVLVTREAVD